MKIVAKKTSNLKKGDVVAVPVLYNGAIIVSKNAVIDDNIIQRLKESKIPGVKIKVEENTTPAKSEVVQQKDNIVQKSVDNSDMQNKLKNKFLNFQITADTKEVIYTIRQLSEYNHPEFLDLIKLGFKKFADPLIHNELLIQLKKFKPDREIYQILHNFLFSAEKQLVLSSLFIIEKIPEKTESFPYILRLLGQTKDKEIINNIIKFFTSQPKNLIEKSLDVIESNVKDKKTLKGVSVLRNILNYRDNKGAPESLKKIKPKTTVSKPPTKSGKIRMPVFSKVSKADEIIYYAPTDLKVNDIKEAAEKFKENYVKANSIVENIFEEITGNKNPDIPKIKSMVSTFVDEIFYNRDLVSRLRNIFTGDTYLYSHAVNVCVLSILTGLFMDYGSNKVVELGIAALLSDVGMMKVDNKIWNNRKKLTDSEKTSVKYHIFDGLELLKKSNDLKDIIATVSLQHHERLDGSGYMGQYDNDITEYSKIVAIADVFDALTSNRPYRKAFSSSRALSYLISNTPEKFDKKCMNAFLKHMGFFPLGTNVLLSNGQRAIISGTNNGMWIKPKISIANNNEKELNLKLEKNLYIKSVIMEEGFEYEDWSNI